MRIGIYDPYLDTLGGHERYCLDIAACLAQNHDVDIFWDNKNILKEAQKRFFIDTKGVRITDNIFQLGLLPKLKATSAYDVIFFVSDGSIPFLFAKKSILSFQFPVPWVNGKNIVTKIKMQRVSVICNSPFVKRYIDTTFGISSQVLTPAIDTTVFTPGKKEKIILSVGRFTQGMNTKKQRDLIDSFKTLCDKGTEGWKLIMAGGMLLEDRAFVSSLKEHAHGYPVEIQPNVTALDLQTLYGKAGIFWHAAGYNEDLSTHPERAEHFGISTIEAMSAGAVPVVFAGGGQKDIIENSVNGYLWTTTDELISRTQLLIGDIACRTKLANVAKERSKQYGYDHFCKRVNKLIEI